MNFNALIAVLILKNVITEDEGERLVEHLNDKPQSTVLKDAIAAVAEVIGKPQPVVPAPLGPVGPAQQAEELAARAAAPATDNVQTPAPAAPAEPELAANEAVVDPDQADDGQAAPADEPAKPSDTDSEDKAATDEPAKTTPDSKPTEEPKKK